MFSAGYLADVDLDHGTTLNKKIRNAQLAQYNFIFGKTTYCVLLKREIVWRFQLILFASTQKFMLQMEKKKKSFGRMNSPSLNSKAPANSASQGGEGGRRESEHKLRSLNTSRSNFLSPPHTPIL